MEQVQYYGTGRRKTSTARVRLVPGTGVVTVNNRDASDYFPYETQLLLLNQPLVSTETQGTYDVLVNDDSGGFTGQAGAIRHNIARALHEADPEYLSTLKSEGFLTREPMMTERKKAGFCSARRKCQFPNREY